MLGEKQYQLGELEDDVTPGVVFGLGCPVEIKEDGFAPGAAAQKTNDSERATGDGVRFGKDQRTSATWSFSLFANATEEEDAWDAIAALAEAWDATEVRETAGVVMPLYYRLAGQERVVYGRPGRWAATPTNLSLSGRIDATADFRTVDPLVYDAELQVQTINLNTPLDTTGGIKVPTILPTRIRSGRAPVQSKITVGGKAKTPAIVTFYGPLDSGASVTIDGWTAQLAEPVLDKQHVVVDARSWVRSATKSTGGSARVNPRVTRISKMLLSPGKEHSVVFLGTDQTGTGRVTVAWRNARRSPR